VATQSVFLTPCRSKGRDAALSGASRLRARRAQTNAARFACRGGSSQIGAAPRPTSTRALCGCAGVGRRGRGAASSASQPDLGRQLDGAEEWNVRDGSDVNPPLASPFRRITAKRLRRFPDAPRPSRPDHPTDVDRHHHRRARLERQAGSGLAWPSLPRLHDGDIRPSPR